MSRTFENPKIVSQRLKELRKEKKITQQELAEKTGISINSLKNYECARRVPDRYNLHLLSEYFRVDEKYILGSSDYKGGDNMKLFPHQQEVLKQTEDINRVAYYLDMGLG